MLPPCPYTQTVGGALFICVRQVHAAHPNDHYMRKPDDVPVDEVAAMRRKQANR